MQDNQPDFFTQQKDFALYVDFLTKEFAKHYANISQKPTEENFSQAWDFITQTSLLHAYSANVPLQELYTLRGKLAKSLFNFYGYNPEFIRAKNKKNKYKLGIYLQSLERSTETRATLPLIKGLDKNKFELSLCTLYNNDSDFAKLIKNEVSELIILSRDLKEQIDALREQDFDVLIIANNSTAVFNFPFALTCNRVAALQVLHFCQPFSTHAPYADAFILGDNLELKAASRYSEKIIRVAGSGIRFHFEEKNIASYKDHSFRTELGIANEACVLISGSNLYKLSPIALDAFARILASAPHTELILYPFGPAWSNSYPVDDFVDALKEKFANQGVDLRRCHVMKTLESEQDVLRLLASADIYLDSFVHSGATSLLDPLCLGLTTICLEQDELRMAQGAGILKDMGIYDTIAKSEDHYVELAVNLAYDQEKRAKISKFLLEHYKSAPVWEYKKYGQEISKALIQILES